MWDIFKKHSFGFIKLKYCRILGHDENKQNCFPMINKFSKKSKIGEGHERKLSSIEANENLLFWLGNSGL